MISQVPGGDSAPVEMEDECETTAFYGDNCGLDSVCYRDNCGETVPCAPTEAPEAAEPTVSSDAHYFTFTRGSGISRAEDGTELLYEYTCDTDFTAVDPELQLWVDQILEQIRKEYASNSANLLTYAQNSLVPGEAELFYGYSNYQELGIPRHDSKVVSLVVLSSVYSGGSHPNTVQTAWNLDMQERTVLSLREILVPGTAGALSELVKKQVEETFGAFGEGALFEDYGTTIDNAFSGESFTPYWYLNDRGLVIFFNQYTLGPYAAGIIKTEIPYEALSGILSEPFFPGEYDNLPGDLLLRSGLEGCRGIPVTVETEGERLLIGVEGEVYQLQLSEVSWLEGTAIGQRMWFSANHLTQRDVIELTAIYDQEEKTIAVEFMGGQGGSTIYYIHPEGMYREP
jgi:hypothetical protein